MSTPETVQEAPAASVETSPLARTIELTVAAKEVEMAVYWFELVLIFRKR